MFGVGLGSKGGSGGGGGTGGTNYFTATAGQIVFTVVGFTPAIAKTVVLSNGVGCVPTSEYTIAGQDITFITPRLLGTAITITQP